MAKQTRKCLYNTPGRAAGYMDLVDRYGKLIVAD